jgi:hydrogenase-4 component F
MTSTVAVLALCVPALPLLGSLVLLLARTHRQADRIALTVALPTSAAALALAVIALARGGETALRGSWYLIDGASAVLLAVTATVGLCSVLVSPGYLRNHREDALAGHGAPAWYYTALFVFWAALLAVPIIGNLAVVWLVVEATTAASALLVAFNGTRDALEAGWKYLVLTTLGLSVALLGIVILAVEQTKAGHPGLSALSWHSLQDAAHALPATSTLVAFVLLLAGLATKIGWAPVHNWLPDAHSEAPAPISAMLSAALLPSVLLVAWRVKEVLQPSVGVATTRAVFIGFGLASILVAVPFLWRSLPWKRLLAYSSLEHMGVIALGIGIGTPLAITGVVLHIAGHALAKSLGFYAALPLLRDDKHAATQAPGGVAAQRRSTAAAMGVSLVALAGLPPSPLFVSELLILLAAVTAGETLVAAIALVGLALGFLGLLHALIEGVIGGEAELTAARVRLVGSRSMVALTSGLGGGLLTLTAVGMLLPGSGFIETLTRGGL